MQRTAKVLMVSLLAFCASANAATYYADPATGSDQGDGSSDKPWKTLAEVVKTGALKKLQPGDTLALRTGYHGDVSFSGDNADFITIAADKDQKPTLSKLTIPGGSKWRIKGLTISPSFGEKPYGWVIVNLGESAPSSEIIMEDCFVYSALDNTGWDAAKWMSVNSGIHLGRRSKNMTLRNNYVLNTRGGIALAGDDTLCEGNVVSDFSADGIRTMRDGQTVQYNVVKNVYVSPKDGDENHDDGIQCFLFGKTSDPGAVPGTVRNVKIIGNIILNREDEKQPLQNFLQAVGFFDGPLIDFVVTDNVVLVEQGHGVSLYDARNAKIERNVCWVWEGTKMRPWVMLGTKGKNKGQWDNTVKDNYACSFNINRPGTVAENNQICTQKIYDDALAKAIKTINEKFGATHPTAGGPRLGKLKIAIAPASTSTEKAK